MTIFNRYSADWLLSYFSCLHVCPEECLSATFQISWALCLPLISIILNWLAVRAIGRDEVMG